MVVETPPLFPHRVKYAKGRKKIQQKGNNEGNMREHVRTGWGDGYGQKDRDLLLADS